MTPRGPELEHLPEMAGSRSIDGQRAWLQSERRPRRRSRQVNDQGCLGIRRGLIDTSSSLDSERDSYPRPSICTSVVTRTL